MRVSLVLVVMAAAGCKNEGQSSYSGQLSPTGQAGPGESGNPSAGEERRTVSKPDEVNAAIEFAVLEVSPAKPRGSQVVLAVENKTYKELFLIGFQAEAQAQLVDQDGFSNRLDIAAPGQLRDGIALMPRAKMKATLVFEGDPNKAAKLKLWGRVFPVPPKGP